MKASTTLKTLRVIGDIPVQIRDLGSMVILDEPAEEIIDICLRIDDLSWRVFRNMVILEGVLFENIIYKGTDGIVYHQPEEIPFIQNIEVPGLAPGLRLPNKVIVPVQDPSGTIDVETFVTELDVGFFFTPPFTVEQDVLARLLLKVSRIEQLEVFINGVNGIFRFNCPITRSPGC